MDFIKKYSVFLVPVVVLVVSVILFLLAFLTGRSLGNEMHNQSGSMYGRIESLLQEPVAVSQANVETEYQAKHSVEADNIIKLANQTTMRELVSYKILPEPQFKSAQIFTDFRLLYRARIEEMIRGLNAMDAPTEKEIQNEAGLGSGRMITNFYGKQGGEDSQAAIIDAICRKRATQMSVYASPGLFRWYRYWEQYEYQGLEEGVEDCWYSQLALWVYEDVVATIKNLNETSSSIFSSPVKRLLGISFEKPLTDEGQRVTGSDIYLETDKPMYVFAGTNPVLGVEPWTKRACNTDIDVVHFELAVVVDSRAVMPFMKELCSVKEHKFRADYRQDGQESVYKHNQITILRSQVESFDGREEVHKYYRYGDNAVVRLNLVCEYVFDKEGYDSIKPKQVKDLLTGGGVAAGDVTGAGVGAGAAATSEPAAPVEKPGKKEKPAKKRGRDIGFD